MSGPTPLVCFDLGGVLVRICRSWEEGCAAAGLSVRSAPDGAAHDGGSLERRLSLVHALDIGAIEPARFYREVSILMDEVYSPEEVQRVHAAWILGEYPGVGQVIDGLNGAGIETACLSNTNHDHWEQMRGMATLSSLRHRHASHLLGLRKPDAACFRAFERAVNRSGPEIVYFDDLAENVLAAQALGWRAHAVDPAGDTAGQIRRHLTALGLL